MNLLKPYPNNSEARNSHANYNIAGIPGSPNNRVPEHSDHKNYDQSKTENFEYTNFPDNRFISPKIT